MNRIWTPAQDQMLKEGIIKFGYKWQKIKAFMNHTRSVNSLVKRWHYKVKFYDDTVVPKVDQPPSKEQPKEEQKNEEEEVEQENSVQSKVPEKQVSYQWKKNWTDRQDKKLKMLVIESGCMNWNQLAQALETIAEQVQMRWRRIIYPTITKQGFKVGGSLKWSLAEDKILNFGFKQDISWDDEGRFFLPFRTLGSIQARWRRVHKNFEAKETFQNRHLQVRECLKRIAKKQRQALERQNKDQ